MHSHLRKSWARISHNPVWAAVIGTVIAAAVIGIADTTDATLTKKVAASASRTGGIHGGSWGPSRTPSTAACRTVGASRLTMWCSIP